MLFTHCLYPLNGYFWVYFWHDRLINDNQNKNISFTIIRKDIRRDRVFFGGLLDTICAPTVCILIGLSLG